MITFIFVHNSPLTYPSLNGDERTLFIYSKSLSNVQRNDHDTQLSLEIYLVLENISDLIFSTEETIVKLAAKNVYNEQVLIKSKHSFTVIKIQLLRTQCQI